VLDQRLLKPPLRGRAGLKSDLGAAPPSGARRAGARSNRTAELAAKPSSQSGALLLQSELRSTV